ncbi:hypothetical protein D9M68_527950 [compost metagenome]
MREPTSSPSTTVMATGLNTKVALETAAVASVQRVCVRSMTFRGLGKYPDQPLTSGASEKVRTLSRIIRVRPCGETTVNRSAISGPMAMPRK